VRRRISDPRDSGVIEDYAEAHDAQASKPHQASNLAEPKNLSAKKSPNKATLKVTGKREIEKLFCVMHFIFIKVESTFYSRLATQGITYIWREKKIMGG